MAAHCKGPEKRPDETAQGVHCQRKEVLEVARERPGGLEVLVEPGGLELDWWLEIWRRGEFKM